MCFLFPRHSAALQLLCKDALHKLRLQRLINQRTIHLRKSIRSGMIINARKHELPLNVTVADAHAHSGKLKSDKHLCRHERHALHLAGKVCSKQQLIVCNRWLIISSSALLASHLSRTKIPFEEGNILLLRADRRFYWEHFRSHQIVGKARPDVTKDIFNSGTMSMIEQANAETPNQEDIL